ncbi:hypothetical protein R6Q59_002784 [Mikania micrantha]
MFIFLEMEEGNLKEADSLSSQNEANTVVKHSYSALDVAHGFVKQYYKIMQSFPTETHNFYKEQSILSHPCADGSMKSVTTLKHGIDDEIMASNIKEWNPNLNTVHAQDSIIGSMFIQSNKTSEASPSLDDVANPLTAQQANDTEEKDSLEIAQVTIKDQTDKSSKRGDGDTKTKFVETSEGKKILSAEPKKIKSAFSVAASSKQARGGKKNCHASIVSSVCYNFCRYSLGLVTGLSSKQAELCYVNTFLTNS